MEDDAPSVVSIVVNGGFCEAGYLAVMRAVTGLFGDGADTVFIDMQAIRFEDVACLEHFAAAVMSQRTAGRHLQVVAREPAVYDTLAALRHSRDWLMLFGEANVIGRRRAIHVDRGGEERS